MSASEIFTLAPHTAVGRDQPPPCAGSSDSWLSESPGERASAARMCAGCPLLEPCAALASEIRPRFGVFGGRDFTPKTRKARTR